jgi:inner membrane protein
MDNLCHTLAGLAFGEAGLKRKTPLAAATLVIGANLPDLDGLAYWLRPSAALGFRRGWTHGVVAMMLWPLVLAGAMLAWDRLVRRSRRAGLEPPGFARLLFLSAVGVWSHPLLDLMNVYGVRLLMPLSARWFYGDTLFIIDPWVWLALALGIVLARRAQRAGSAAPWRPARIALAGVAAYVAAMAALGAAGRIVVRRELQARGVPVVRLMVAPVPLNPLRRQVVAQLATGRYMTLALAWRPGPVLTDEATWEIRDTLPAARAAAATPAGRAFLGWARFPFFVVGPGDRCPAYTVCLRDLRYAPQPWAEVAVPIGGGLSSPLSPRSPEPP